MSQRHSGVIWDQRGGSVIGGSADQHNQHNGLFRSRHIVLSELHKLICGEVGLWCCASGMSNGCPFEGNIMPWYCFLFLPWWTAWASAQARLAILITTGVQPTIRASRKQLIVSTSMIWNSTEHFSMCGLFVLISSKTRKDTEIICFALKPFIQVYNAMGLEVQYRSSRDTNTKITP